ncbi:hypothetical protein [Helicobacter suis]|uniref:hypothetical protein n=1 Tax=Helicobacter suis TaxID=104628 RepID=UPI0013D5B379|nr:hypothetical protein [Helicobacter suis]
MNQLFKLDRNFLEFSTDLDGIKVDFKYYALSDAQNRRLLDLSARTEKSTDNYDALIEFQYQTISENLICTSHIDEGKEQAFLETLKQNGKTAEFLNFVSEQFSSALAQKKASLKP